MADTKITSLQPPQVVTNPATDVLPIVNIADPLMATSGSTRKITVNQLLGAGGTATLASATITGDLTVRTNKLAVTSNGVGIGTATPAAGFALDIQTAAGTAARIKGGSGSGQGSAYYVTLAASTSTLMAIGDRANIFGGTPDTTASIYTGSGIPLTFDVGGSTAMTLNSTGLGVGGSPNSARLTVARSNAVTASRGTIYAYSTDSMAANLGGQISFGGSYTGTSETIFGAVSARKENGTDSEIGGYLQFSVTNNSIGVVERMRIDSSGTLRVKGAGTAGSTDAVQFNGSAPASALILDASGNLGVGSTPVEKVTINGSASLSNGSYLGWGNADALISGSSSSNFIFLRTNATERMRVKAAGQVRFVPLAADPAGAEAGDVYYNSSSNKLKCYNGTTWNDLF